MKIPLEKVLIWIAQHLTRRQMCAIVLLLLTFSSGYIGWKYCAFTSFLVWQSWLLGVILPTVLGFAAILLWFGLSPFRHTPVIVALVALSLICGVTAVQSQIVEAPIALPIFLDAYTTNAFCDPVRQELKTAVFHSTSSEASVWTKDVQLKQVELREAVAEQAQFPSEVANQSEALERICASVAHGSLSADSFFATLNSIESRVDCWQPLADCHVGLSNAFVPINPFSSNTYITSFGATGRNSIAAAINRMQRPEKVVDRNYALYVTLLICDSVTSAPSNRQSVADLYRTFVNFGNTIGPDRAAIWIGTFSDQSEPDIIHARAIIEALRPHSGAYQYSFASGPYLVFTHGPPDSASDVFPMDLGPMQQSERLQLIDKLSDTLSFVHPAATEPSYGSLVFQQAVQRVKSLLINLHIQLVVTAKQEST